MYEQHKDGEISALQSFIIIINIMIGTGIMGISRSVAEVSQQDAWISVFINGIFISFIMIIIVYTISKFPQYNFLQYTSYLLSKPIGYLITLAFTLYGLLVVALVIRFLTEMVITWLLPNTPSWIINFVIALTTLYMTKNGATILARFNEVIVFMLIPFGLLVFIALPQSSFINLRPIGGSGISNILKGIMPSFFAFAGYEELLVYYPYISDKQRPIMKQSAIAVFIVGLFYTLTVMAHIALYGPQEIRQVLYPSINYLMAVEFPIVERMEIFYATFWTFTVLATIGIQYLASCILLQNIFSTKKTSFFVYIVLPIVFTLSLIPQDTTEVISFSEKIGKLNIFFGLLLPIILFLMYFIRGGKNKKYEKNN